ncbi:hypothetical protein CHARACLAT_031468 [Characodon lateralis]|uniref:Uncharacterized protein n=1 Tax=Characodon lateralis TaxID=208331 RepID=A0ABU7EYD3_9TELE|nr:hypothetical protein [Characodon lateralis]
MISEEPHMKLRSMEVQMLLVKCFTQSSDKTSPPWMSQRLWVFYWTHHIRVIASFDSCHLPVDTEQHKPGQTPLETDFSQDYDGEHFVKESVVPTTVSALLHPSPVNRT